MTGGSAPDAIPPPAVPQIDPHQWARLGISVFPLVHAKKKPATHNGFYDATTNPDEVSSLFSDQRLNLGLRTGSGLVVIDIDSQKPGTDEAFAALEEKYGKLPHTMTVRTRAGGHHLYLKYPEGQSLKSSAGKLAPGIDVRADGGYVVGPGSWVEADDKGVAGTYVIEDEAPIAELPPIWLGVLALLGTGPGTPQKVLPTSINSALTSLPSMTLAPTPENIARVDETVQRAGLSPDDDYDAWRDTAWSILSLGEGWETFAREWSERSERFTEEGFRNVVSSYQGGRIGFERIIARAHEKTGSPPFQPVSGETLLSPTEGLTGDKGDILNGRLFAERNRGRLIFVPELGECLTYDEVAGWTPAHPEAPMRAAKDVIALLQRRLAEALPQSGGGEIDPRAKRLMAHINRSSTAQKLRAMVEVGRSEDGMTARASELDANPYHLGLRDCVIDLGSLQRTAYNPNLLITKRTNTRLDKHARCPRWTTFLREVLPDREVRRFLRVFCGHMLVGRVEHQRLLFLHGTGANGNSILINVLAHVLGDHARSIPTDMLMRQPRSSQGPSPDLMMLKGLRLAFANETEEGSRLAESRVKGLTSAEPITAREPYGRFVTFNPSHSLIIVGNHTPIIHDDSWGMWRRVCLIPFDVTIPVERQDPKLLDKLTAEADGIMMWLLSGLREYQKNGLVIPKSVDAATHAYRDDMDSIGEWLKDACVLKADERESKTNVFASYRGWAESNGYRPMSGKALTRRLKSRGISIDRGKRHYLGLAVRASRPAGTFAPHE